MNIYNCDQYSEAWWAHRSGIPTASRANELVTPKRGDMSTQSRTLVNSLIAEKLGVSSEEREPTEWMLRGKELEPEARDAFEMDHDVDVEPVGFITNQVGIGIAGCSPDGLLGGRTVGFEVKCPKPETQIGYLLGGALPEYYKPQVHFSMAVTGCRSWWFMSYFPELDPLYVQVHWDDYTDRVLAALVKFNQVLDEAMRRFGL